jgi:hypothetical protein
MCLLCVLKRRARPRRACLSSMRRRGPVPERSAAHALPTHMHFIALHVHLKNRRISFLLRTGGRVRVACVQYVWSRFYIETRAHARVRRRGYVKVEPPLLSLHKLERTFVSYVFNAFRTVVKWDAMESEPVPSAEASAVHICFSITRQWHGSRRCAYLLLDRH